MTRDPLITTARLAIWAARGLLWFLAAVMLLVFVGSLVVTDAQFAETSREILTDSGTELSRGNITLIAAILVVTALLAERFFQQLLAIVDTVGEGEPFSLLNAQRLERMALLALLFMTVTIDTIGVSQAGAQLGEGESLQIGFSFDGLLFALILFVLARVFRQGVSMREDLEGTV